MNQKMAMASNMTWILIDEHGHRLSLTGGMMRIGRGQDNDLVLPDANISNRHAQLEILPDRVLLSDLGSTNGTFVNGHPISSRTILRSGDEIRFGRFRRFSLEGEANPEGDAAHVALLAGPGWEYPLRPGTYRIGRAPDVDIRLDGPGVSNFHAVLTVSSAEAMLHDQNSTNGTFVDGVRISRTLLRDGQQVCCHKVCFRFFRSIGRNQDHPPLSPPPFSSPRRPVVDPPRNHGSLLLLAFLGLAVILLAGVLVFTPRQPPVPVSQGGGAQVLPPQSQRQPAPDAERTRVERPGRPVSQGDGYRTQQPEAVRQPDQGAQRVLREREEIARRVDQIVNDREFIQRLARVNEISRAGAGHLDKAAGLMSHATTLSDQIDGSMVGKAALTAAGLRGVPDTLRTLNREVQGAAALVRELEETSRLLPRQMEQYQRTGSPQDLRTMVGTAGQGARRVSQANQSIAGFQRTLTQGHQVLQTLANVASTLDLQAAVRGLNEAVSSLDAAQGQLRQLDGMLARDLENFRTLEAAGSSP